MAGGRELLSNFVPFVCARPFRTHAQEGGEEGCVQVPRTSRTDFGLQVGTPRQGRMHEHTGCDNAVGRFTPTLSLPSPTCRQRRVPRILLVSQQWLINC